MTTVPTGKETAESLINWFWNLGLTRTSAHAISSQWLRSAYVTRDLLNSIENGLAHTQTSFGLWGPSQSGKSTLVSQFVDGSADATGGGGLLDWNCPALFSSRPQKAGLPDLPESTVVFNPHNMGSDASGCVSRFRLVSDSAIPHQSHPVEIRLLDNAQLMHAISAGYASECKVSTLWSVEQFEKLLETYAPTTERTILDKPAFEFLHEVINVIELLIECKDVRLSQLNASGHWPTLVGKIFDCSKLLADKKAVAQFAARLLWDGHSSLNQLFLNLVRLRSNLPKGRLFCSLEVAATIVNIDSFKIFLQKDADEKLPIGARRIRKIIRELKYTKSGDDVLVEVGGNGSTLIPDPSDFGLLQGIVRELVIPLRARNISPERKGSGFVRFLEKAELVDFPGLPNRDRNAQESLLDVSTLDKESDPRLLTEVLKRGKVASLVNSYSRTLSLDAFVILARAGKFIPKVDQLHRGLAAWWQFVDPKFDPYSTRVKSPPLPLFFNLTFFAEVIDKVASNAATTGLLGMADQISQLNPYANPNLSTLIATTYPLFKDGSIVARTESVVKAIDFILNDQNFKAYCRLDSSKKSLLNLADAKDSDGGVDYLFSVLESRASTEARTKLLESRCRGAIIDLLNLIQEQAPQEGNEQVKRDVAKLLESIHHSLVEKSKDETVSDASAWVSFRIRKFLDVVPEELDPLPQSGLTPQRYLDYVNRQIQRWTESKSTFSGFAEMGIQDNGLRIRILELISTKIDRNRLANWIRNELPNSRKHEDNRELRRVFAILMASNFLRQTTIHRHPKLDGDDGVIHRIRDWAASEESKDGNWQELSVEMLRTTPHYYSVIGPFETLLTELSRGDIKGRGKQPGDEEIAALLGVAQVIQG